MNTLNFNDIEVTSAVNSSGSFQLPIIVVSYRQKCDMIFWAATKI